MRSFLKLKNELLKRADVRAEHDAVAEEFSLADAMIREGDLMQAQATKNWRS